MCTSSSKAGKYAELLREDDDGNTRDVYGEREPVKPISLIGKERQTVSRRGQMLRASKDADTSVCRVNAQILS